MDRKKLAIYITEKLISNKRELQDYYQKTEKNIGHFILDDLLPENLALEVYRSFPNGSSMRLKKTLREYKYIAAQMNLYSPILEEIIYAFQDPQVIALISEICGIKKLYPDEYLYAGGISMMSDKHYLNPHLDNSHDKDRSKWRVLNLLYYVTPCWQLEHGGNLELWPDGVEGNQITIHSKFNRLAVMATHDGSWHSVSPINEKEKNRCCVSNYYFCDSPLKSTSQFHVTSFRGRPEQKLTDLLLRADIRIRMITRKIFTKGLFQTKHLYKK